ncbi:MAG: hypothetical protein NVS9B4_14640 [Candidatus Acidiferrum sp.]
MNAFCSNCGGQLSEGSRFCPKCGKSLEPSLVSNPAVNIQEPAAAPAATPKGSSSVLLKVLGVFLVLIILFGMAVVGSGLYIAYRVKKKAEEVKQAYKSNDLGKILGALGADPNNASSPGGNARSANARPLAFPALASADSNESQSRVLLRPGLTIVTAISQFGGDYESIKRIKSVTRDSVSLSYRADNAPNPFGNLGQPKGASAPKPTGTTTASRTVRTIDLQNAHEYFQWFGGLTPEVVPGTTAISLSSEILSDLKTKGETPLVFRSGGFQGVLGGMIGGLNQMSNAVRDPSEKKEDTEIPSSLGKESCTLKRVGDGVHAFPVLFNDQRVTLPAVHAQCETGGNLNDFYLLDDVANPLALAWKISGGDTLQVIKISYPPETEKTKAESEGPENPGPPSASGGAGPAAGTGGSGHQIEQQLAEKRQVEIYGIYFDFASDQIKPESEPVLKEIGTSLQHNPSWKLNVEGHTDNIGGDAYNQELSQHRAEAVKRALVERYHIASNRLTPAGFGASRPKETNDTLEGRARNRRVELARSE